MARRPSVDPRLGERILEYLYQQEGLMVAWTMERLVGNAKPLTSRRHRVEQVQRGAADAMERAVG